MIEDTITKYFKGLLKLGAIPRLLSFVYNSLSLFQGSIWSVYPANRSIKLLSMALFGPVQSLLEGDQFHDQ